MFVRRLFVCSLACLSRFFKMLASTVQWLKKVYVCHVELRIFPTIAKRDGKYSHVRSLLRGAQLSLPNTRSYFTLTNVRADPKANTLIRLREYPLGPGKPTKKGTGKSKQHIRDTFTCNQFKARRPHIRESNAEKHQIHTE